MQLLLWMFTNPNEYDLFDSWTYGPLSGSSLVIKAGKAIEM